MYLKDIFQTSGRPWRTLIIKSIVVPEPFPPSPMATATKQALAANTSRPQSGRLDFEIEETTEKGRRIFLAKSRLYPECETYDYTREAAVKGLNAVVRMYLASQ